MEIKEPLPYQIYISRSKGKVTPETIVAVVLTVTMGNEYIYTLYNMSGRRLDPDADKLTGEQFRSMYKPARRFIARNFLSSWRLVYGSDKNSN